MKTLILFIALVGAPAFADDMSNLASIACSLNGGTNCPAVTPVSQERERPTKQTDMRCVSDCESRGYSVNLCYSKCSYEVAP